jgi:hypothetical protein
MDFSDLDHQVPSARVVREAGAVVATPRRSLGEHVRRAFAPLGTRAAAHGRNALIVVVGLWPLTAIVAVASALIWAAGYGNSP